MNAILKKLFGLFLSAGIALGLASAAHAQAPGRVDVLIGFPDRPTPEDVAVVRAAGGQVRHVFSIVPAIAASVPERALIGLSHDARVRVIELDGEFHLISHGETSDVAELNNTWGVKHIQSGQVHAGENTGAGVKVAVIDSGIDGSHSELSVAGGWNFVSNNSNFFDDNGHGTHVAGTIAAAYNNDGVVGVAPEVELYALKVLNASGSGSFSSIIAALEWCVAKEINISNNSYGSGSDPGTLVRQAFDNAATAGVLHVAAAGNSGNAAGKNNSVGYPARYDSVIAVAATTQSDTRASFSSTGPTVELSAPGVGILSSIPGGGFASWNGTSMASPHVAGAAALIMSAGQTASGAVRQILRDTAKPLGSANQYGYGLVQAKLAVDTVSPGTDPEIPGDPEDPTDPDPEDPQDPNAVSVFSISYSGSGGKTSDRHLTITLQLEPAIGGAAVSVIVALDTGASASASGTTGSNGQLSFVWNNAPAGCYETTVTALSASGATWDGLTPDDNEHCK